MSTVDPIEHRLTLACPPARAFAAFTHEMGDWWDPAYTPDAATYTGIALDPTLGGDVALSGAGSSVSFRHGGWTPGNDSARHKYSDWPHLLARYAAHAVSGP